jgi:hypothetical protein
MPGKNFIIRNRYGIAQGQLSPISATEMWILFFLLENRITPHFL